MRHGPIVVLAALILGVLTAHGDSNCTGGASTTSGPGALIRGGGNFFSGGAAFAGPFVVDALNRPSDSEAGIGFRGAR